MKTVIYGSRPDGHAKVLAELATRQPGFDLVGLVDVYSENREREVRTLCVLGGGEVLPELQHRGVEGLLIGFGASIGRADVAERASRAGLALPNLVHDLASVSPTAHLGVGVQVLVFAYIGPDVRIGDAVLVNTAAVVEHDVVLEDGVVVLPHATIAGRARIGREATVGAGATVLPDVRVGAAAFVAAGAVVIHDVAPMARVGGVPARALDEHSTPGAP